MSPLQRLARALGYDLVPRRKAKVLDAQLRAVLEHAGITCVLDVGANLGQYAARLRAAGYAGRIVSFEPVAEVHTRLSRRAAGDPAWQVAPRMALGEHDGEVELEVAAETDMSSILPQSRTLRDVSPTSRVVRRERVPLRRLDAIAPDYLRPDERLFVKLDTQGYEPRVLAGATGLLERILGLQVELSLVRCYEGEKDFRAMIDLLAEAGFSLHLVLPGYFERKLARQLQFDGVFMREGAHGAIVRDGALPRAHPRPT